MKDFICLFQLGLNLTMNDALAQCQENFRLYWGQKLVNTLRALHELYYTPTDEEEENLNEEEPDAETDY